VTTNTGFVITDAGAAAATIATPIGPFVHINQFRITDAFNWVPDGTETTLPGALKYTGGITNYYIVDYDTVELILFMDGTVGPFNFGTIGIYLADGTLFATSVFDTLQEKIKAVGNQGGTQWRIRARLKLARASVICQVDVITSNQVLEVSTWPFLVTPANQVGNANMAILTGEENSVGESIMVFKDHANQWVINDYHQIFSGSTGSGGIIGTSSVSHADLANISFELPQTNSRYLIKFPDGDIRRVTSITGSTQLNFASPKAVTQTGTFTVWEDNNAQTGKVRWADRSEYNYYVTTFMPYWSTPSGTWNASNNGANQSSIATIASGHPTLAQWTALQDKVIRWCKIHSIPYADITASDYVYTENNANGWGLQTFRVLWERFEAKLPLAFTNRNVWDVAFQESTVPAGATATRVQPWGGVATTKTHTFTLTYADANTLKALINNGHQISINASVATGANANWLDMKNFLAAMGTIVIGAGDTTVTGSGGTLSGIGLHELTGVTQLLYSRTATISGGPFTVNVYGIMNNPSSINIAIQYINTGTGYYASGINDLFTSSMAMRRPSSTVLNTPVLAYPAVSAINDF
jgi:hypothetical protein